MVWIDIKTTHKNHVFLYYKKCSIVVVIFLFLLSREKSVTLRDVLCCFLEDRITVINFKKTLVVSNILERLRTSIIEFYFYCVLSTLLRCAFDFSENWGENVKHHLPTKND